VVGTLEAMVLIPASGDADYSPDVSPLVAHELTVPNSLPLRSANWIGMTLSSGLLFIELNYTPVRQWKGTTTLSVRCDILEDTSGS